jgi:hypothetical protein
MVYVGKEPAQIQFVNVDAPKGTFQIGEKVTFNATIFNAGEVDTTTVLLRSEVWGKTFENGKEIEKIVYENENKIESIPAGKTSPATYTDSITAPGNYRIIIRAEADNAGYDEESYTLNVGGTIVSTCSTDNTTPFEKKYDAFEDECREKRYCTGCAFAFECRNAWESVSSLPQGSYFDPQRGESTFTYLITPATNGGC